MDLDFLYIGLRISFCSERWFQFNFGSWCTVGITSIPFTGHPAEGDSLKQSIIDGKGHNCATTQEGDNIKTGQELVPKQSIFQSV